MFKNIQRKSPVIPSGVGRTSRLESAWMGIARRALRESRWLRTRGFRAQLHSAAVRVSCALFAVALLFDTTNVVAQAPADAGIAETEATFRFDPEASLVLVPVDFNGRRRLFFVNTGAGASVFDISYLNELGRPLRAVELAAPNGSKKIQLFRAPTATADGLSLNGVSEVPCLDFWRHRAVSGEAIYGCLGLDFLRQHVVRLDFDRGEIAFLKTVPSDSGTPLELHTRSKWRPPVVMVSLPGVGRQPFFVGTGVDGHGEIDRRLLETLLKQGLARVVDKVIIQSMTKSSPQRKARLHDAVSLGPFLRRGVSFIEADDSVLGLSYLRRYLVTFDFPGQKLYLKERGTEVAPSGKASCGAVIWRPNGATTVYDVKAGSDADLAGLKADDVVEEIDLELASSLALRRLHVLLSTPGEHILHVRRGEQSLRIVLHLQERSEDDAPRATERDGSK